MTRRVARLAKLALGWALVLAGIAALVLPGPGLLILFTGLALLSQEYEWARRAVEPVRVAAFKAAAHGVKNWRRLLFSLSGVALLVGAGILWVINPPAPAWWPASEGWWLPGGWGTGVALIGSGLAALALVVYSYRMFRGAGAGASGPDAWPGAAR